MVETVNATIVPGPMPSNRDIPTATNDFHVAHAYAQEGALRKTAKQIGVTLVEKTHECKGCFFGEGPVQRLGGGGDVTVSSPFREKTARKYTLPETCLTNPLVK